MYCDLGYIALSKPNPTKSNLYNPYLVFFFYVKKGYCITLLYQLLNFLTFVQVVRIDI